LVFKCVVISSMRLDSKATCVSGLPVSVGVDPYCATIAAVASVVSAMFGAPIFLMITGFSGLPHGKSLSR